MFDVEYPKSSENVVLAALQLSREPKDLFEEDLSEMKTLISTAGATVMATVIQKADRPTASTYFGSGKIHEIKERMVECGSKTVIIDAELKPSQIQNIERMIECKVIDRSQLILDIFSLHAKTNEARIQVELAQLEILYPRLTRMWQHLSRQDGGIGTRGPGETQLETDRRLVQKKISVLKDRLKKIKKTRDTQRKSRGKAFRCTLVGYTNVGKSTLLNAMSGADVLVENKLFATLDTSTRKTFMPGAGEVVVSDTVGFIRKLPHDLVASFRSTLEVVHEADLLLIIMDASSQWYRHQMDTVKEVLVDLDAEEKPYLVVFNKTDLMEDPLQQKKILADFPKAVFTSAMNREMVTELKQTISERVLAVRNDEAKELYVDTHTPPVITAG